MQSKGIVGYGNKATVTNQMRSGVREHLLRKRTESIRLGVPASVKEVKA
jgi:hypothetical protein